MKRSSPALDELADALLSALPAIDESGIRLALATFRQLAKGAPVSEATLAQDTGLSRDHVREQLASWPGVFRDDSDNVVGFFGLSIGEMPPHRYRYAGTQLWTWCAYDTLYITHVLGGEAQVESVDALTGQTLRLSVTPNGVTAASHPGLVMSFLQPDGKFDANVVLNFCHFVHFFASQENGSRWTADHPGTFLLDLADAFELSQRHVRGFFKTEAIPS